MHAPAPSLSTLVGRDRELAILRERLAAALAGQGSLVLISGEAGIGKSALAEVLGSQAGDQGARVLAGRCFDLTETPAYGPWRYLFERYRAPPDAPPPPPAFVVPGNVGEAGSQTLLFQQVRDFLKALTARQPVVLLLDDAQWSDPASLDLLRFIAHSVDVLPLLIVVTYRSDELADDHSLAALLPILIREAHAERLDLHPLDDAAVETLVVGRYLLPYGERMRLKRHLQSRAQGNPYFLGELLRALEEDGVLRNGDAGWTLGELTHTTVPPLLRQVIDRRFERLAGESQRLLIVAAVIGQEVPLDLWAAVAGADEDALADVIEQGLDAHVLRELPAGDGVQFVHALMREAIFARIPAVRRRPIHRRVGEALVRSRNPDPDAVAYHFQQAGDERAAAWLRAAGEQAERAYAWLTAADRFEAALALPAAAGWDVRERFRLLCWAASLRRLTNPHRGIATLEEAERLAVEMGDDRLAAYAVYELGHMRCVAGELRRGVAEMERGIAALDALFPMTPADTSESEVFDAPARRWGSLATWLARVGRFAEVAVWGERGGGLRGVAVAHAAMGHPIAARRAFAEVHAWHAAQGQRTVTSSAFLDEILWVALPYLADEPDGLRQLGQAAIRAATDAAGSRPDMPPRVIALPLMRLHGEWAEARPLAEMGCTVLRHGLGLWAAGELICLAHAQGDTDVAWSLIDQYLPIGPATEPGDMHIIQAFMFQRVAAALAIDAGDLAKASAWLDAHDRWLAWSGAMLGLADGQLGWAAYHRAVGDPAAAEKHAQQALDRATEPRQPLALLAAHRLLGELATDASRFADAQTHLDAALALADACAAPYERALTLLALATLCLATRETDHAAALLDQARAICIPLKAAPALARADALAARVVASPQAKPLHPDGLTAREVEVLQLIAGGRTNQEIAATLFLSIRTVERHITSIYRRIGARGRADATAYAVRHDLIPLDASPA